MAIPIKFKVLNDKFINVIGFEQNIEKIVEGHYVKKNDVLWFTTV